MRLLNLRVGGVSAGEGRAAGVVYVEFLGAAAHVDAEKLAPV